MTRLMYEKELELLKTNLEEMARYVESAINRISEAIETGNMELAENIIKNDRSVNDMERSIESKCLSIITTRKQLICICQIQQHQYWELYPSIEIRIIS